MFERFTRDARQTVVDSLRVAADSGAAKAGPEHMLLALAEDSQGAGARILSGYGVTAQALRAAIVPAKGRAGLTEQEMAALRAVGIDPEEVFRRIEEAFGPGVNDEAATPPPRRRGRLGAPFDPRGKKVLELSLREAVALRHKRISSAHLLLGLLREGLPEPALAVLSQHGVTYEGVRERAAS